jgi:tetratricopeptide (TPR) repeat protein
MQPCENLDTENKTTPHWLNVALVFVCICLIICNVVLVQKYKAATRKKIEKNEHREYAMAQLLQEKNNWEIKIRFLYPHIEKILLHWEKKEYAEIIECTSKDQDYSSVPFLYYIRGMSFCNVNQEEKAIQDLSCYLDIVCFSEQARLQRAKLYQKQQKISLALQDIESVLSQNPESDSAKHMIQEIRKLQEIKKNEE